MWTENFKMFKLDLEKAEESEIKLPTSIGSSKKQKSPEKKIFQSEAEIIQICSNKQGLKKKITMSITN